MRIGTVYTLYGRRAGAELSTERIIAGLVERFDDNQIVVFCNDEAFRVLPDHPRIEKRAVLLLKNQFGKAFWLAWLAKGVLSNLALDVFWIPSGTNSFPGRWKIPSVVTFYDLGEYFVQGKYDFVRTFYRKHLSAPRSAKRAASIVTPSQATANDVRQLLHPRATCHVVYLGPSPHREDSAADEMTASEKTEIDRLDRIFFCPGRTDYAGKGLDVLLKGYRQFCDAMPDAPPVISVGPMGNDHDRFVREIDALGLGGKLRYLGRVSHAAINALYAKSIAVLYPTRFEGFGFPVLEAMQHNTPVICSNTCSLPEIGGDAALYIDVGDAAGLCAAMESIYKDKELACSLITKGQAQLAKFDWAQCISSYNQIMNRASNNALASAKLTNK